jgi:hypothetical protein
MLIELRHRQRYLPVVLRLLINELLFSVKGNSIVKYCIKSFMHWCNKPIELKLLMKNGAAIVFLLAFFLQTFNKPFIVASYYAITSSYEARCENKAKPQLQCHGKCQLVKTMQEEEKKDAQQPERRADNKNEIVCNADFADVLKTPSISLESMKPIVPFSTGHLSTNKFGIFHPPRA